MKTRSFAAFTAPSVVLMLLLLALPLAMTLWLSVRTCTTPMELVTVQQTGPFGTHPVTTQRAKVDAEGRPMQDCRFVGGAYYRAILGLGDAKPAEGQPVEFLGALRFTLMYIAGTTPFVLGGGLALALAMNHVTQRLRGAFIAASLLPFIITPVVGALALKWLFRDGALVPHLLSGLGVELYWMAQPWSAQLLVVLYGIWHVLPFAFIVFYAGLQSVPQDALEAATLDGASRWQKLRFVTLPHLMPLVVFVTLIHLMDAYRVFEPVVVLTQGAFTTSVQYLTYHVLLQEDNPYKASAAAVLTIVGIAVLLVPLLRKTWREQRGG
ncbi:MAG: carbohydrate ABC transporter permease [Rubrivivax sp.]|jgi:multiple sugar transport system permease protein